MVDAPLRTVINNSDFEISGYVDVFPEIRSVNYLHRDFF